MCVSPVVPSPVVPCVPGCPVVCPRREGDDPEVNALAVRCSRVPVPRCGVCPQRSRRTVLCVPRVIARSYWSRRPLTSLECLSPRASQRRCPSPMISRVFAETLCVSPELPRNVVCVPRVTHVSPELPRVISWSRRPLPALGCLSSCACSKTVSVPNDFQSFCRNVVCAPRVTMSPRVTCLPPELPVPRVTQTYPLSYRHSSEIPSSQSRPPIRSSAISTVRERCLLGWLAIFSRTDETSDLS